jgi:glutamate synthase (NADPH/NADH) small chain
MGKITGFMELERISEAYEPPKERVAHYREFVLALDAESASKQGARCMDCGIPFCQTGCPVNNIIPDWNDLVYLKQWRTALDVLHSTNNFPEFTGRICPAPCEEACTLNINDDPVGIKSIEHFIIDKGWEEGWVVPLPPAVKTGRRVAVVGSGPAGLACSQQLARAGHDVVLYEKADRIGGLLRYGIPDFKMERHLVDRRMAQMSAEGVEFRPSVHVGKDVAAEAVVAEYDAVVLTGGAEAPRDLPVPGRDLAGVHFAMEFLPQQNRVVAGDRVPDQILATGKHVIVIGGGDTGSDCVGTSNRQRAKSITQFELLPQPPEQENKPVTWPYWPIKLRTSSSHQEGCDRDWAVATKRFEGRNGRVEKLVAVRVEWRRDEGGAMKMVEVPDSQFEMKADLVLLAMGFVGPVREGMLEELAVAHDPRGNVRADAEDYRTSVPKVFAAGDLRRGQSLVVWAIREGRQCARAVDEYLMGRSLLPR